jgi:dTDP-4-dehydrorhamnose 3,5-epimerase
VSVIVESSLINGVCRLVPDVHTDDRGEFWRSYCRHDLADSGIEFLISQSNVSVNPYEYTLRGFHYQRRPASEMKLLTVLAGSLQAVIVDIRQESPTFLSHVSFHLDVGDRSSLLVPEGCATGFLTLVNDTIVHYQMSNHYQPDHYAGFRYDDPVVGARWLFEPSVLSDRDRGFAALDPLTL